MEPVNHTTMHISWHITTTVKCATNEQDIFYKDHPNYLTMPQATQSPVVKADHAAWWKWYEGDTVEDL